jgi:hypothetical protein
VGGPLLLASTVVSSSPSDLTPPPFPGGEGPAPPPMMAPPPGAPSPPAGRGAHLSPERMLAQKARGAALLVVILLLVTTACFTVYVVEGLHATQSVFNAANNGHPVVDNETANTTIGPLGSLSQGSFSLIEVIGGMGVVAILWVMAILTTVSVVRPSSLRNPAKLLDVFYMNMLFGFVFWPLAAIGALLPDSFNLLMVALGLIPALVLSISLGRFVEEGFGNRILFVVILGAISVLMATVGIAWSTVLSGGYLDLVGALQVVPVAIFVVRSFRDRTEPIRTRPFVSELFLWSAIGEVLAAAVGIVASGGFSGLEAMLVVITSIFTGMTALFAPLLNPAYASVTGVPSSVTTILPAIFGVVGLLTAFVCLLPLMQVGDLYLLRTGNVRVAACPKCHRTRLVLSMQEGQLCNRCRAHNPQIARRRRARQAPRAPGSPPPQTPSSG